MKNSDKNNEIELLLVKYLAGEADKEQIRRVEDWKDQSAENLQLFKEYEKLWQNTKAFQQVNGIDLDAEWEVQKENILESADKQKSAGSKEQQSILFIAVRVAAAAVLILGLIFGIRFLPGMSYKKIATQESHAEIILPDSTVITLNAWSEIKYPRKFKKKNREVSFKGEAFFEVKPDKTRPFRIKTSELNIEVLGTSFNVNSYGKANEKEIVVTTGKVAVNLLEDESKKIILQAGDKGAFQKDSETLVKKLNNDINYAAWKTRKLVFINESFGEIIKTIEKVYFKKMVVTNHALLDCRITATFDQLSYEAVLSILESTLDLRTEKKGDLTLIFGDNCR